MLWYSMENPSSRAFFQKRIGPIFLKEEIEKQIKILQMKRKWNLAVVHCVSRGISISMEKPNNSVL